MTTSFQVKLTGLDEVRKKMQLLPERIGMRAMRRALRRGANVVKAAAAANAKMFDDPDTRESITRNLTVVSGGRRRERTAGGPMMRVGVIGGAAESKASDSAPGGATWYWRHIEFGTSQMRAQPFLRAAASSSAGEALQAVAAAAPAEIDKELAKL